MPSTASTLTEAQHILFELMSDVGECHFYAGWRTGLEFAIWDAMRHGPSLTHATRDLDASKLEGVRIMSADLGGWITWLDSEGPDGKFQPGWGPRFIPMAEWLARVAARKTAGRRETDLGGA